jgi:hypothetical protein
MVEIYGEIYPYKQEMDIYYQYKIVGKDTIFLDTVIFPRVK